MKKNYPQKFIEMINSLLKEDAPQFWDAFNNKPPVSGLRINPSKTNLRDLQKDLEIEFQTIPWSRHGAAFKRIKDLGKHPYHKAGLYYIQEPSAMVPVDVLNPQPGDRVLDLCAAPGGKTTQIQSRMGDTGILIANDPNPRRVEALTRNLDRWGARTTAVLCESPRRISEHLGSFFDRVLVDAPCSGEGTFREDPGEIKKWSPEFSQRCCRIQDEILWFAAKMVRPGGFLVYSTCTFNQDENEGRIAHFLKNNPCFRIDTIEPLEGYSRGIPMGNAPNLDFSGTVRIWPHKTHGEGHFAARLKKSPSAPTIPSPFDLLHHPPDSDQLEIYNDFFTKTLKPTPNTMKILPGSKGLNQLGNRLYWIPEELPTLEGLNVRHWGWWLGTIKSGKWLPSPVLATALNSEDVQKVIEFSIEDPALLSYLRGSPTNSPPLEGLAEGWVLVSCSGYSLGWGAVRNGRLKSYLPRWLRSN